MIELCIEDYCQTCPYFEEDVERESLWGNGTRQTGYTYIRCEHRKICERIVTMMKEKNENQEVEKRNNS